MPLSVRHEGVNKNKESLNLKLVNVKYSDLKFPCLKSMDIEVNVRR